MILVGDGISVHPKGDLGLARRHVEALKDELVGVNPDDQLVVTQAPTDIFPGATMFRFEIKDRPQDGRLAMVAADDGSWRVILDGQFETFRELLSVGNLTITEKNAADYVRFAFGWVHIEGAVVRFMQSPEESGLDLQSLSREHRIALSVAATPTRPGVEQPPEIGTVAVRGGLLVGGRIYRVSINLDEYGRPKIVHTVAVADDLTFPNPVMRIRCTFHTRLRDLPNFHASNPNLTVAAFLEKWNLTFFGDSDSMRAATDATQVLPSGGEMAKALTATARVLVRGAVATAIRRKPGLFRSQAAEDPASAYSNFIDHVARMRSSLLVRCDYAEIFVACVDILQSDLLSARASDPARLAGGDPPPQIRVFDGTTIEQQLAQEPAALRREVREIARSSNILLLTTDRVFRLPAEIDALVDMEIDIPRIDGAAFAEIFFEIFTSEPDEAADDLGWARYLIPRDIARAAVGCDDGAQALVVLRETALARAGRHSAEDAPSLDELEGLGEAKAVVQNLIVDIRSAREGSIRWTEVDRGMLLAGPPGTGKTTLARTISKACGIRFVLASASTWQQSGHLGDHLRAIRDSFAEARNFAPAVLFIDEIDSIGSRESFSGANATYNTAVVNAVLEELQGFRDREGVIVIGATNDPSRVDPALRRAGRLDRVVSIPLPTVPALIRIFDYYLRKIGRDVSVAEDVDTRTLGRLSFGRTGADVEFWVRGARRRARKEGRVRIEQRDLIAEVLERPQDASEGIRLSPEEMHRVAVHEAGHAILSLTGPGKGKDITYVSIVPKANGALGFVARYDESGRMMTRADIEEYIRILLGGRAAEAVVFGEANVSSGAGAGPNSDLAVASRVMMQMQTQLGFSKSFGLVWMDWGVPGGGSVADSVRNLPAGDQLLRETRQALDALYSETQERLTAKRPLLDRIIAALLERQELDGEELRKMVEDPKLG